MRVFHTAIIGLWLGCSAALAQHAAPPGMSLAHAASRRFPQPVRVESLIGRQVLQPLESQPTLGWVSDVVKRPDGTLAVVLDFGGFRGLFSRRIAVPLDAMVLLGEYMEVMDLTPEQLRQTATFDAGGTTPVPRESLIRVGLAAPSH